MASEKNLQELFHEMLKDIYFGEKKILSALPEMAKAAQSQELKAAFELHETETAEHVARLEKVFKEIDETPSGKTCDAIMGIIEEGQEVMKQFKDVPALDAGILGTTHLRWTKGGFARSSTSTWTRSMRRWSSATIRACAANRSRLAASPERAAWWRHRVTKRARSGCARRCPWRGRCDCVLS